LNEGEKNNVIGQSNHPPGKNGRRYVRAGGRGVPAVTKMDVFGRGKQKGITVGEIHYDEIPKEMLMVVCNDEDKDDIIRVILRYAKTGEGTFGDGRIFVSSVEEAYTVSTGKSGL
jgi:nitrogen regulatory protein PII 1